MKLRKNYLILTCLFSSLLGLLLIYLAAINIQPKKMEIDDITQELVGKSVTIEGKIVYKNSHPSGHLFLTVSNDRARIQVPLFAGFLNKLNENGLSTEDFDKGKRILVTGIVDEYNGQLQVIPRKSDDIKLV